MEKEKPILTIEQVLRKLRKIRKNPDVEVAHGQADDLLLEFIECNFEGGHRIRKAYEKTPRWYS